MKPFPNPIKTITQSIEIGLRLLPDDGEGIAFAAWAADEPHQLFVHRRVHTAIRMVFEHRFPEIFHEVDQ